MQVKVAVHESKVESVRRGMRARIRVQDRELQGTVTSIANQPESSSWSSANVKEYATIVRIDGEATELKPGMTAEVEILVDHKKDVLSVPVQAVVEQGGKFYCWVRTPGDPERRAVVIGATNDKFIEIKDGLLEGDEVLLNPRALVSEAREDVTESEPVDVQKKFGSPAASDVSAPRPSGPAGIGEAPRGSDLAAPPGDADGTPKRRREPGGSGGGRSFNLMQYDSNGDGAVSRDEAPEFLQSMFERSDTNGDGKIDSGEIAAMRERFRSGGAGGGGGRGGDLMQNDQDGDGKISRDEAPEWLQPRFDRIDSNGNGFIEADELSALRNRAREGDGSNDSGRDRAGVPR
jgi:Ca2+-binding EF-hand superfamily protein